LTALLDEGAQRRLLTVVADAGFGKSTLLSSWSAGRPCAWHTVRSEDRSLAAMVSALVVALRSQVPALEAIPPELQSPRGPDADAEQQTRALAYAALLADALDVNLDKDLILVLDDLHELDPQAPATRLIEGLVRTAPSTLHLIVASRSPMPFGIDRLRGRGQVLEIDATALQLLFQEFLTSEHLVCCQTGVELDSQCHEPVAESDRGGGVLEAHSNLEHAARNNLFDNQVFLQKGFRREAVY